MTQQRIDRASTALCLGLIIGTLLWGCADDAAGARHTKDSSADGVQADADVGTSADAGVGPGAASDSADAAGHSSSEPTGPSIVVTLQRDAASPESGDGAADAALGDANADAWVRDAANALSTDTDDSTAAGGQDASRVTDLVVGETVVVLGGGCGLAYDASRSLLFLYPCSGSEILGVDLAGGVVTTLDAPGENADDVDMQITTAPLILNGTSLPPGTLLFFNGESGVTEVYAVDVETDVVLASLTTSFGASHVVGGAHHPARDSLFLVQDRVPGATDGNVVAEVEPSAGAIGQLITLAPNFDVNYGDLDVCVTTSNLLVVSSIEASLAEFTPEGQFVQAHPLPSGVTGSSGIAVDSNTGQIWVASTSATITRLDSNLCPAVP